jgi:TolB-like protein/DNA-binding winged helix-turn-helix (wHTH) protein/Flp pilus assembly protein TadD
MMVSSKEAVKAQFAGFELDFSSGELTRNGRRCRLQGQPFLVLRVLLDRPGKVVTREELQRQLWPSETFVDFDHGLNKAIAKLREALEDPKANSKLIETLPRRGYRFTADVIWVGLPVDFPSTPEVPTSGRSIQTRYWLFASLALLLLMAVVLGVNHRAFGSWFGRGPLIQSIAVLPLVNLSNDPEQEYFADGMTDQLITDLSYAKSLRVVSRASTIGFKKSPLSLPQIAERLHVDAVMEGTALRTDNSVRITIRLTAAKPERQLWAASFERDISDTVTLQKQIAAEAVAQIQMQFTPEDRTRLSMESRISPEAYDEYLRARFLIGQETTQLNKAVPHLERAIQLDPNFAAAYAALGEAWGMEGVWGGKGNRKTAPVALEYSKKAVSLDPNSSEAYASLGHSLMQNRQWNDSEIALRRALEIDPNNATAAEYLALLLTSKGRTDESVRIGRELAIANPVAMNFQRIYALTLYRGRRYDEAIAQCRRVIELDPNHNATYGTLGDALVEEGRYQEAEAAFRHGPEHRMNPATQAWLYAREGNSAAARQILNENPSVSNPKTAVARYLLGEQEAGLAELDHLANDLWMTNTYVLKSDPSYDPMRSDTRFSEILKKTGLSAN